MNKQFHYIKSKSLSQFNKIEGKQCQKKKFILSNKFFVKSTTLQYSKNVLFSRIFCQSQTLNFRDFHIDRHDIGFCHPNTPTLNKVSYFAAFFLKSMHF